MPIKEFSSSVPGQTTGYVENPLPFTDYIEVVWLEERAFLPPKVSVMARRKTLLKSDRRWCSRYVSKIGTVFRPDLLFRVKGTTATVTKGGDIGRDGKTSIFTTAEVPGLRLNPPDPARLCAGLEQAKAERALAYAQAFCALEGFLF